MILLLGATGYIGQAFARELRLRGKSFIPLSRGAFDYTRFELLFDYVRQIEPEFLINAAGYASKPEGVRCPMDRLAALQANTLLPQTISRVCVMMNIPWGHVSSGSIYSGAKVVENGQLRVEPELDRPEVLHRFAEGPERFHGFTERDEPNSSFRHPPCDFFSGTKALAEEQIRDHSQNYIWRFRLPFDHQDRECNLLWRLQRSAWVSDGVNSLSHLADCARACLDLWERQAPFGIYNVTNPGAVTTRQLVQMVQRKFKPPPKVARWEEAMLTNGGSAEARQGNCILDVSKLLKTGVELRHVTVALEDALEHCQPASGHTRFIQATSELTIA